jgi:sulfate adenylyltransferase large subunit
MADAILVSSLIESSDDAAFSIDSFLAAEKTKDLLRFSTAGSVDDGKSTLIGRLLYDSRNVYEDQVLAVTGTRVGQKQPTIDFAQLTDGLRAEREQGITIDVAYRYFSTQRRKFIIADTPGHEQYTRNMATGASTADLAIILIDARKGILTQSRRHAYIASLLGIRHLVAAVNKMDLVDFSQNVFETIAEQLRTMVGQFGSAELVTIPVSALDGDNVVEASSRMPWYTGPTLLQHLEQVPVWEEEPHQGFRLPVQRVIRPDQFYRGFAGQIAAGTIRKGDEIVALPSGRKSRVASITTFDSDLEEASAPQSIALTLEDELDISRGDVIADPARLPQTATAIEASLVWFDADRLESNRPYLLKHGTQTLSARITRVLHRTNIQSLEEEAVHSLGMNDIGVAEIQTTRAIFFDAYAENRASGSFILIDPQTNATLAAGMIRRGLSEDSRNDFTALKPSLLLVERASDAELVERQFLVEGQAIVRTRVRSQDIWQALLGVGVNVLLEAISSDDAVQVLGTSATTAIHILKGAESNDSKHSVQRFLEDLRRKGILSSGDGSVS